MLLSRALDFIRQSVSILVPSISKLHLIFRVLTFKNSDVVSEFIVTVL